MSDDDPGRWSVAAGGESFDRPSTHEVDQLIALSSLGTPEAVRLREQTPAWLVRMIAKRIEDAAENVPPACIRRADGPDGIRLAGADLAGEDLREADLSGADLSGANLSGACLAGADLSDARLQGADLSRADLEGAIIVRAVLDGARMHETILDGASLFRAQLDGVRIHDAKLRFAYLREAVLREAVVEGADLTGADLQDASLHGAVVVDTVVDEANVAGAEFDEARLSQIDVTSCVGLECRQLLHAWVDEAVAFPDAWPVRLVRAMEPPDAEARPGPMFHIDCGTVVKDCQKKLRATSREELAGVIRDHARGTHAFDTISSELAEEIMTRVRRVDWSRLLISEE
jgi:uncharacterized protein YjbI with pentapeptide repeats/predicted small metal-binding protein